MRLSESYYYFESPTGLALRQKYVNFESFVNQFYLERSTDKHVRNVFLFDKNFAVGMIKFRNNTGKIVPPIDYVYSSSQIHSMNDRKLFGVKIQETRKNLLRLMSCLDSRFVLSPRIHTSVFSPLRVNSDNVINGPGAFTRMYDTEYKILEDFSNVIQRLNNDYNILSLNVNIEVEIYTRLEPCKSCKSVAGEFIQKYPNSTVRFYFDRPY
ncbi:deaminase domain-containing protein [Lysinibacillus fusiformis]|uniref:deaminase domain-containing protein n=1 Tax=Lysinibacillus fusiformis TaxID=28031 RepID=UPI00116D87D2|nr:MULTISPECIES: deaminase domain-containing protein [Lysinibacillus]MED4668991.1 deaminase domain-containing protein [Lysinibacillus fusiformis]GED63289.1 hypothetical protein LFU01_17410 [Lysinibacillus fusiformis]